MESSDSNETDRDEEQMSQNTNNNRSHVNERAIIHYVFQF